MESLNFDNLLDVYRSTVFSRSGNEHVIRVSNSGILDVLKFIDTDDAAAADSQIFLVDDISTASVGSLVRAEISSPKVGLGLLVQSLDSLLETPEARTKEPHAYFIIEDKISRCTYPGKKISSYRNALSVVAAIMESASFVDTLRNEIVFVKNGRFSVPIVYDAKDVVSINEVEAKRFSSFLGDDIHRDQRLQIIKEAVVQLTKAYPASARLAYILRNLNSLNELVHKEYGLYASSFSYEKIREELEAARIDYIAKIHKTFIDIQGQLLGVPVAAFVVASQLKPASSCSTSLIANVAILLGAWIFVAFLALAVLNQWLTLGSIAAEIVRQRSKLEYDYAEISGRFLAVFDGLRQRILIHYLGLGFVFVVAVGSGLFALIVFNRFVSADVGACIIGSAAITS